MAERAIVNYGIYKFSSEERASSLVRVTAQVEREPSNRYSNLKLQRERSFYGYAQVMIDDWIHSIIELQYGLQVILEFRNEIDQHQIFHYCTQKNVAVNLNTVSTALGGPALTIDEDSIAISLMPYDRILFKLYNDTTLLVNVNTEPFINPCEVSFEYYPAEPVIDEPSNRDVPANPGDAPYDIPDAPYDTTTADNGETYYPTGIATPSRIRVHWRINWSSDPTSHSIPNGTDDSAEFDVPDTGYVVEMQGTPRTGTICPAVPQTNTVAVKGSDTVVLFVHDTCNIIELVGFEYI